MKPKPVRSIPVFIALGIIVLVCLVRWWQIGFLEHLELMTFDLRVREAVKFTPVVATNLGFIEITDLSAAKVLDGSVGFHFGLFWPRQVYGRLVEELALQGAKAVALDVVFAELRPYDPLVEMADGSNKESDQFFADQMHRSGNVILAATTNTPPPALFFDNALALGDIVTEPSETLRRAKAFRLYRHWHSAFAKVEADPDYGVHLEEAIIEPHRIVLPRSKELGDIKVPLDADGNFALADFYGDKLPPGVAPKAKPFTEQRVWHMGVVLGAQELKLDLANANVDLKHGRITLRGPGGVERIIPVDGEGFFYIDWCMLHDDSRLTKAPIQELLAQNFKRLKGQIKDPPKGWAGKLVVVGSTATGRNLSDLGATPLSENTALASEHWNVANSIITGRFVHRAPFALDLALIALMGTGAALLTWRLRALQGFGLVILVAVGYVAFAVGLYVHSRYWIPIVLPVVGGLLMNYLCLVTWRVVFEQADKRRLRSIFSKVVSPKIVQELLQAETLSLLGARRQVTVFFADVRGFTALTDTSQERVAEYVRQKHLTGEAAEACYNEAARATLDTVNLYLGVVADTVIRADGTLDKFIGDCVMAFWGAPTPNPKHASACVRAAIAAQCAIYALNQERAEENKRREVENTALVAAGQSPKPMLPILLLGSGINTGTAYVGLMGSQSEQQNYTVFGHDVNLASRLESASGRGRIYIGQTTYEHLLRDDPSLAATCTALPGQNLKGISALVTVYEVPWRPPDASPFDVELTASPAADGGSHTGFIQRGGTAPA